VVVAVVRKWWLPLFGKGGCRCSAQVVDKCHLQTSQMAFATIADGICNHRRWHLRTTSFEHRSPPLPNIDHQGFRTSATTLSEGRRYVIGRWTMDWPNHEGEAIEARWVGYRFSAICLKGYK